MLDSLSQADRRFLQDVSLSQDRASRAQLQLSSGFRVSNASDDPSVVPNIIATKADFARSQQVARNLGVIKYEVDSAEQGLARAASLLDEAGTAAVRGMSQSATATQRLSIADEIGGVMTALVQIANTQYNGRYIFSGDSDQQAAYSIDLTQATPVSAYQGTSTTRQVLAISGAAISVGRTAQQIFDSPTPANNVFGALTALRASLLANDPVATATAMDTLHSAAAHLNAQHAAYGAIQQTVSAAQEDVAQQSVSFETQRSKLQDADAVKAALEAAQARTAVETAFAAHAQRGRKSLFDYLG